MIDAKAETLLAVAECRNFTKAAQQLSITQPAVSHQILQMEKDFGVPLFIRKKGDLIPTNEGKIAIKYARRLCVMERKMRMEIADAKHNVSNMRVGVTHTSESNMMIEVLARCSNEYPGICITIITDTIKNLYEKLEDFEIDIAIIEGRNTNPGFNSLTLDTDYLVCVLSVNNPLARHAMIRLEELKRENLILRSSASATRMLFESTLESINESISDFNVIIEVDNVATIKDLIRKDLGVSILAKSACMDELRKGKIAVLPIENLSMIRDTNMVYHKSFSHIESLRNIARIYRETAQNYNQ